MDEMTEEKKTDFQKIIQEDREKYPVKKVWEGTMLEYLEKVQKNPEIVQIAPARVYNMIMSKGTIPVDDENRLTNDLVRYGFFEKDLFGIDETIHALIKFFKAGAMRTETGKRILILVGPVSGGKSTIASLLKKGLENYEVPLYAIKDCPMHEDPLHLIPRHLRKKWEKILGVRTEGDLCPRCRFSLLEKFGENGKIHWEKVPVKQISISERGRTGIGTFQPSDPKNQDINELIGHVDLAKITQYSETDPRAYRLDGELQVANRGLVEYIEILKCDIKFHHVLISVAQEQLIKAPGFPMIYTDLVIISHTNPTEYNLFKGEKKNEALHDRMYVLKVPYCLKVSEEVKIYEKLIRQSDFHEKIHLAPHTLKVAAMFSILSRLEESELCPDPIKKMKYYDGQKVMEKEKDPIDVKKLQEEGKAKNEGMKGISPRFIMDALDILLGEKQEKKCINPVDVIKAIKTVFDHRMGYTEEEKAEYTALLMEDVKDEYAEIAKKEVGRAFVYAYEDQAQALFNNYIDNIIAYCNKKRVKDPITDEELEPDEKLMRAIEEQIGVPESGKREFRQGVLIFKASRKEFTFASYEPLQDAIEKKLFSDLKPIIYGTLADETRKKDRKTLKRLNDTVEELKTKGYCEICAQALLGFVGRVLKEEGK